MTRFYHPNAKKGDPFEDLLILTNNQYKSQKVAVIHKIPTAWIPIRGAVQEPNSLGYPQAQGKTKIVGAKVEDKAVVDFLGRYHGLPIAIEAKHTESETIRWDRVEQHQEEFLDNWTYNGEGIGIVLVSYQLRQFYMVPWKVWKDNLHHWRAKGRGKGATVKLADLPYRIKPHGRVAVDYLAAVDGWLQEERQRKDGGER